MKLTKLYSAVAINAIGNWLTFLAMALLVSEKWGAQNIPLVFLAQTLPGAILPGFVLPKISTQNRAQFYLFTQGLLALNSVWICFAQSIWTVYLFLFIGSLLRGLSLPILNSFMGLIVPKESRTHVYTKIGSIQMGALAIASLSGAWIKMTFSTELLFLLDAISFVLSALLLVRLLKLAPEQQAKPKPHFKENWIKKYKQFNPGLREVLISWFIVLGIGALLNAIEFSKFKQLLMSDQEIGAAMAAWGIGTLITFWRKSEGRYLQTFIFYTLALIVFGAAPSSAFVIISFVVAGLYNSYLSGQLRASIQNSIEEKQDGLEVWTFANQVTNIINVVAYVSAGMILKISNGLNYIYALMASLALAVIVTTKTGNGR